MNTTDSIGVEKLSVTNALAARLAPTNVTSLNSTFRQLMIGIGSSIVESFTTIRLTAGPFEKK
ncbi:hypothetical protein ACFQ7B_43765, partial [Streptomyces erythrochromogenes]|uniref:hypothetical protein n=1 Tax=Streptomyces erythrochromogenes TaxID=285574 RepID=UPI003687B538